MHSTVRRSFLRSLWEANDLGASKGVPVVYCDLEDRRCRPHCAEVLLVRFLLFLYSGYKPYTKTNRRELQS